MATEATEIRGVGHSIKRVEDDRFIRGKGTYIDHSMRLASWASIFSR